jgi:hypothetical protein
MIIIPGQTGKDLCDRHLKPSRRDVLRVGGSGMLGLSLGSMFQLQAQAAEKGAGGGPGWGKAKSIIMVYLQGGPSHLDLWDPKDNVPDNVRSPFKAIPTRVDGVQFTEILPKLAQVNDKFTLIRSMSYTPNGLFNHTAAIYQMMTGYTTDKVSPSGQLEPPSPKDFPNFGSNIVRLRPPDVPMLPFVMLPRPLQESNVVGKGGTAGFLGKAYDPYTLFPDGDDMDMAKMDKIKIEDLKLRPEVFATRLERRSRLREQINAGMPQIEKAVSELKLNEYYEQALSLSRKPRRRAPCTVATPSDRAASSRDGWWKPVRAWWKSSGPRSRIRTTTRGTTTPALRSVCGTAPAPCWTRVSPASSRTWISAACWTAPWWWPWASSDAARRKVSAPPATAIPRTAGTTGRTATRRWWPARGSSAATSTASPTRPAPVRAAIPSIPASSWLPSTTPSGLIRRPLCSTT